ncbi:MAG TPA: hypothetical protein ENN77_02885, partial [Candidatus Wirthbacteria bacterium]|nr:hypothetical protein [Candidatus Wirthbacteria bacterium]
MSQKELLLDLTQDFSPAKLRELLRTKNRAFRFVDEPLGEYEGDGISQIVQHASLEFPQHQKLLVVSARVGRDLTERSAKKKQYELAKKILKAKWCDAGIFFFYDERGVFRCSLVHVQYFGTKRRFNNFRRFSFYVHPENANKTFIRQLDTAKFETLDQVKEAFSLTAVTDTFYDEFMPQFKNLSEAIFEQCDKPDKTMDEAQDFALLFVIRIIFLGFVQKKGWLGDDDQFLQHFLEEYEHRKSADDTFYSRWLKPLFFEALNSPQGAKVAYQNNEFSPETENKLQMAPYLNGGIFSPHNQHGFAEEFYLVPDEAIKQFFEFIFSYNFTIEENTQYDEELELNPEFLGIIFERIVNKEDGAVYTPRPEVDLMCRLSLVKWLQKTNHTNIDIRDLYELFFREAGTEHASEADQKHGSFSENQIKDVLDLLENLTVCDPAVGSGAFPVGMLQVIDEVEQSLRQRIQDPGAQLCAFERKKRIIGQTLYGVEVKRWAVWICHLRLWTSLFVDAPDDLRHSQEPLLPSLEFKIRRGDSLVQMVGSKLFPVSGHAQIGSRLKAKVTVLRKLKLDYYYNRGNREQLFNQIKYTETNLFREIIDTEITDKKKLLSQLKQTRPQTQAGLFGDTPNQQVLQLDQKQIDRLSEEIAELEEQKKALQDEHPLIWNIEFSEIFADERKGGFDIVIGNPPYVRQESIADPDGKIKTPKDYKDKLREMVHGDYPKQFANPKAIDAKSDLYAYFYLRALRLLNPGGLLTFICSNSWLDVGYGVWMQK